MDTEIEKPIRRLKYWLVITGAVACVVASGFALDTAYGQYVYFCWEGRDAGEVLKQLNLPDSALTKPDMEIDHAN